MKIVFLLVVVAVYCQASPDPGAFDKAKGKAVGSDGGYGAVSGHHRVERSPLFGLLKGFNQATAGAGRPSVGGGGRARIITILRGGRRGDDDSNEYSDRRGLPGASGHHRVARSPSFLKGFRKGFGSTGVGGRYVGGRAAGYRGGARIVILRGRGYGDDDSNEYFDRRGLPATSGHRRVARSPSFLKGFRKGYGSSGVGGRYIGGRAAGYGGRARVVILRGRGGDDDSNEYSDRRGLPATSGHRRVARSPSFLKGLRKGFGSAGVGGRYVGGRATGYGGRARIVILRGRGYGDDDSNEYSDRRGSPATSGHRRVARSPSFLKGFRKGFGSAGVGGRYVGGRAAGYGGRARLVILRGRGGDDDSNEYSDRRGLPGTKSL